MTWDEIKDFKIGRAWTLPELDQLFAVVRGGVALPGKQPGFAVVAGLRHVRRAEHNCEVYVLDEYESPDLRQLLRQCSVFARKYNTRFRHGESLQWVGDARNSALQDTINQINNERRGPCDATANDRDRLMVVGTRLLDMLPSPYPYMVPLLRECLDPARRQLFLQDSTLTERLSQIQTAEDLTELAPGSFPAIEALAFIVANLKDEAEWIVRDLLDPPREQRPYDPRDWI